MEKIMYIFFISLCFNTTVIKAQTLQTPCSTTSQATIGSIVINYTIGEMVLVDSYKSNGLLITQGILQPEVPNGLVNYSAFTDGDIKVFPNPTPDLLSVQISILKPGKMKLQLIDALGQILITDAFDVNAFTLKKYDFKKYAAATYVLKLQFMSNDNVMDKRGSFKIVKQ